MLVNVSVSDVTFGGLDEQMSMNTDSFSVLKDNQKTYAQTSRAINPYASKEEQMAQVNHSGPDLYQTKLTMKKV
jgi:hypothetical protein